jgi:hypothetical protein
MITGVMRYRLWIYHGVAAEIGAVMMLLVSYLMFRGRFWKKEPWNVFDIVAGISAGVIFFGFVIARWIDVLH